MNSMTTQHKLIDTLINTIRLKNDAALSRVMGVAPPVISKIRAGRLPVGDSFLINAHEESGISIAELKDLAGLPKKLKHEFTEAQS